MQNKTPKKIKIARIATVPMSFTCLENLLEGMESENFEIHLVSSQTDKLNHFFKNKYRTHQIDFYRNISIPRDLRTLYQLYRLFRAEKFDIVHSHTPKAGLLVAIAGLLSFTPIRLHTYTGQVWANYNRCKKKFFILIDRFINDVNTFNYVDGLKQKEFLIENKVVKPQKIHVFGKGSHYGINFNKFRPNASKVESLKKSLGLENKFVLGFAGRLHRDKGIPELVEAFTELKQTLKDIKLLLVGPIDKLSQNDIQLIKTDPDIIWIDFVEDIPNYISLMSVFIFPSKREGFPMSVLEASSLEKPVILTDIYGNVDTVLNNETGQYFSSGDKNTLKQLISKYYQNPDLIHNHGRNGLNYVKGNFSSQDLVRAQIGHYWDLAESINAE